MIRSLGPALLTAACASTLVASVTTLAAAAPMAIGGPQVRATNSLVAPPRELIGARELGHLSATAPLHFSLVLPLRNRAELAELTRFQQMRGSAMFHRWLTPQQFAVRYGPDDATVARAIAALRARGFAVAGVNRSHTLVRASGTAAGLEQAFSTQLSRFAIGNRIVYANRTLATVPVELANLGATVVGLDNVPHARPFHVFGRSAIARRAAMARAQHARALQHTAFRPFYASGASGGFTPGDLAQAYDFPLQAKTTGGGSTIGIVISNDYNDDDISSWYSSYNVNRTGSIRREAIDGGGTFDANNSLEVTLDIEQSTSLAPGANEVVYEMPDLSNQSILDAYDAVVSDNSTDVISSSFGGCEQGASTDGALDQVFAQGVAQGQTWFASSGDQGSGCPGNSTGVNYPASDPNVVAVGGTTLSTDASGNFAGESAWSGSGGGVSTEWGLPAFQSGVAVASASGRNVPDISLNADPNSGDELIFSGQDTMVGGTSASSPGTAAEFACIVASKGRQGLADTRIYALASGGSAAFHDVTSGSNGAYSAGPGYDDATGWGSYDGNALLSAF